MRPSSLDYLIQKCLGGVTSMAGCTVPQHLNCLVVLKNTYPVALWTIQHPQTSIRLFESVLTYNVRARSPASYNFNSHYLPCH